VKPGDVFRDCAECPEMVIVQAGSFLMGSPKDEVGHRGSEEPTRTVTISKPLAVGRFEITLGQFSQFASDTGFTVGGSCYVHNEANEDVEYPLENIAGKTFRNPGFEQADNHPVVCVSWDDAQAYVKWLSKKSGHEYRLLTEAEWEYAARAGTQTRFSFGHDETGLCEHANAGDSLLSKKEHFRKAFKKVDWVFVSCDDGAIFTSAVGKYRPNGFGLHDMHGNVLEWVQDCHELTYENAPTDGTARQTRRDCERGARGGGWGWPSDFLRSAARDKVPSNLRANALGFRVARAEIGRSEDRDPEIALNVPVAPPELPQAGCDGAVLVKVANEEKCLKSGDVFRDCIDCPEMVVIPAGRFLMGRSGDDKLAQHEVTIAAPLAISKYEVTFAEWDACVRSEGCGHADDMGWGRQKRPAINVSWDDAKKYVRYLSIVTGKPYRLPSEAEWEYAARANTVTSYSFGDDAARLGDFAWHDANSGKTTHPVGEKKPNAFGLHDMHGNVVELVEDCHNETYAGAPTDGTAWTSGNCGRHMARGGSFYNIDLSVRSFEREWFSTNLRYENVGFRVARTLGP
jgi:formylglycine-generating enzyme required for sulfatase activity